MGLNNVEDESHVIYNCDLYSEHRAKLISNLNKIPESEEYAIVNNMEISKDNLTTYLMHLLSHNAPDTQSHNTLNFDSIANIDIHPNTPTSLFFQHRRSYVVNCVCTFFLKCLEKRWKFNDEYRKAMARANTITFNVLRLTDQ